MAASVGGQAEMGLLLYLQISDVYPSSRCDLAYGVDGLATRGLPLRGGEYLDVPTRDFSATNVDRVYA